MSTTRRRVFKPRKSRGTFYLQNNSTGNKGNYTYVEHVLNGAQVTVSEDHDWPPPSGAFDYDRGGNFVTTKSYVASKPNHVRISGATNKTLLPPGQSTERYDGPSYPYPSASGTATLEFPSSARSTDSQLDTLGATAVARCKPTNSAIDFGQFAGELLREGLPRFGASADWAERTRRLKAAGDDYLNVEFGWQPLVSDLNTFADNVDSTYAALQQLRRDDGRLVRRSYSFPEINTSETVELTNPGGIFPSLNGNYFLQNLNAKRFRQTEVWRRQWFSGAFRYFLPASLKGESELGDLRALIEHSLGLSLTPELIWNLTPWSWAVDWFSNTGDVIANITDSQKYGLIMPYGYIMEHSIAKYTYSCTGTTFKPNGATPGDITLVTESKVRRKANPFGFGLTDSSLNSGQKAILAALGLSRSG